MSKITTKAAVCPQCKNFHLVASIQSFETNKETKKEFSKLMMKGFSIVEVSTHEARDRFGYCEDESYSGKTQIGLFDRF